MTLGPPADQPDPDGNWTEDEWNYTGPHTGADWDEPGTPAHSLPLDWRALEPLARWIWFTDLWGSVCSLRNRYDLPVRNRWWLNDVALETLAALRAWVEYYDSGAWDDPAGKLALLYDLERIRPMLRDGNEPFRPERDGPAFVAHMIEVGCVKPGFGDHPDDDPGDVDGV